MNKHIKKALILLLASNNFFLLLFGIWNYKKTVYETDRIYVSSILDSVLSVAKRAFEYIPPEAGDHSEKFTYLKTSCFYQIRHLNEKKYLITVKASYKSNDYERVYLKSF